MDKIKRKRSVTGSTIWTVGRHSCYWNGTGSRLYLLFGDSLVPVDAPEANDHYRTMQDAEAAVRRFFDLPPTGRRPRQR